MSKIKGTLVLLTRNEVEGINKIFPVVPIQRIAEVFAVDGGSTDGTVEFFKRHQVLVIPQEHKGRGNAFRIAVEHAKNENIIFFSPDGNENPQDIMKIFHFLQKGHDMVIASRFMKESRCDEDNKSIKIRKFGNILFTKLINILFKGHLTDSINGFRGIKKTAFIRLHPDAEGFTIEFQLSIRALKQRLKVKEIPTIENERIGGKSTAGTFRVGFNLLKVIIKELFD